jgi:selenide,water dikinase
MSFKLLDFSRSGGCGCKLEPGQLKSILQTHEVLEDKHLLVDLSHNDDAAIIEMENGQCIISSTDFFLPVVNDAYDYGRIAAANAISDIYAMGGEPILALSILGWPVDVIPVEEARQVLKGAADICREAGISIAGGHSINTSEPVFGLCVTGHVDKNHIKKNNTCEVGDYLYLTKPLGLGLLSQALKNGQLSEKGYATLIDEATRLNNMGAVLGKMPHITAMTDVTGFGLLGHLQEMLGDNKGAELQLDLIPVIDEAREIALKMQYPNITTNNYNHIKDRTTGLNGLEFLWLCDPQTSGGLLIASNKEINLDYAVYIGRITDTGLMVLV